MQQCVMQRGGLLDLSAFRGTRWGLGPSKVAKGQEYYLYLQSKS